MRLLYVALLLLPLTAFAQDMTVKDMPQLWSACDTADDCTLILRDCGFGIAVTSAHKKDAERFVDDNHLVPLACAATPTPPNGVACKKGQCIGTRS